MKFWIPMVVALAASPALAGPGGRVGDPATPTTWVIGDGEEERQFAAYLNAAAAPAEIWRRGIRLEEADLAVRIVIGRPASSRRFGDADVRVGKVRVRRDSDSTWSRTITVLLTGTERFRWSKTEVAREGDDRWRVSARGRGRSGLLELPKKSSLGSSMDGMLRQLAADTAAVVKERAGGKQPPTPPPSPAAPDLPKGGELDPLFMEETAPPPK